MPCGPSPLTSFVGRDQELACREPLVSGVRLVTLAGPGGIGKSRLALALVERLESTLGAYIFRGKTPSKVAMGRERTRDAARVGGRRAALQAPTACRNRADTE